MCLSMICRVGSHKCFNVSFHLAAGIILACMVSPKFILGGHVSSTKSHSRPIYENLKQHEPDSEHCSTLNNALK